MEEPRMMQIYIMGKAYDVPIGVTIMDAMEYAGYRFTRGVGCRSGFCGACGTVFRKEGDYRLEFALACQEMVEEGMHLTQLPFTPAPRADYVLELLDANGKGLAVKGGDIGTLHDRAKKSLVPPARDLGRHIV